jgi:hypothetical protein
MNIWEPTTYHTQRLALLLDNNNNDTGVAFEANNSLSFLSPRAMVGNYPFLYGCHIGGAVGF